MRMQALAAAVLAVASTANAGEYDNLCAMGLAVEKDVPTDCSVSLEQDGKTYCFGNEQAKALFVQDLDANLEKAEAYYQKTHGGVKESALQQGPREPPRMVHTSACGTWLHPNPFAGGRHRACRFSMI